jgi:hypothetical protein
MHGHREEKSMENEKFDDTTSLTQEEKQRRTLLQAVAGLAVSTGASAADASGDPKSAPPSAVTVHSMSATKSTGKVGDFNFLAGEWRIDHRRLKSPGVWDEFKGEATCWTVLGGVGSIEELRIPSRDFSGMGVRILNLEKKVWVDFWINGKFGVLTPPGLPGGFKNGEGIFEADDEDNGKPIKVRGVWDRITEKSCRWHQSVSRDGGKTWEPNWFMDWKKV